MNEMDLLTRFRAEVPLRVSPQAEELFRAATAHQGTERVTTRSRRRPFVILGLDLRWRLVIAAGLAAALAAGLVAAFRPPGPAPVLTARLLAARASAAALDGPVVPGGQWIYQRTVSYTVSPPKGFPARLTQGTWSTADGSIQYLGGPWAFGPGHALYSTLGSLPRDPAALDEYLARLSYPDGKETRAAKVSTQFLTIEELLASAVLPPAVNAALYRALGVIPGVQVKPQVTDIAGRPGIAFVLPKTPQSANLEIILDASDYHYLAQAAWQPSDGSPNSAIPFTESALLRTTLVSGPGSTAADPDPPSQAMLTAERAMMTMLTAQRPAAPALPDPRQWIYRKLGTSGGTREVWARADDTEQASYVRGRLVTCARPARCAAATRWLVPAGPAFGTNALAASPRDLLDRLNAYRTGCADVTGYCNAVGVFASTLIGYDNVDTTPFVWYFSLAYVPGVTVRRITDAAGRADVEFRFPFSGGVTGVLVDARTYGFAGYVKDGAQTLLLRQADVSGPGVRP